MNKYRRKKFIQQIFFSGMPDKYNKINNILSRSAQPKREDFEWLKNQGVTDVIDLKTKFENNFINFDEKSTVEALGMNYFNISTIAHHPSEEKIEKFLNIIMNAEKNNGKVHVHCLQGVDRTGMFSYIYKVFKHIGKKEDNLQEWINLGHNKILFPNLIKWTENYIGKKTNKV